MCCDEKVLLIDSDPEMCEEVADFLWEEGFTVESASDEAGWRRRMDSADYDIVILDRKMAGADGRETVRQIKVMSPGARVFVTGGRSLSNTRFLAESISRFSLGAGPDLAFDNLREAAANV